MCLFNEKRLIFLKKYVLADLKRSSKEPSRDALRKRLNFDSLFFKDFYFFDASSISDTCSCSARSIC